jgi:hypothetical protein
MPVPKLPLRLTGLLYPYHLLWWRRALRTHSAITQWNHEHNAIFVHIPKTAGTSVLAGLGATPTFDTHAPSRAYRQAYPELYARAFKFTFVRNPWDRFASSFHFMKHGTRWSIQQDWAREYIGELSFAEFTHRLRHPIYRAQVMAERFFWPQTFWLGGEGRIDGVDQIYRFEELDAAMNQLCPRIGIDRPTATPHLRKVERLDFRTLYDDEMIDIVGRLYRKDIAALGYAFSH